ncbi:TasA family protein [Desulfosporosinus sp. SYSU MS00001]|uniref:TasA family protein n=1 Tax=Desulfosporosinus sp. SYSU MS00001 TaxID=3416284 RepID=UPI003CE86798
MSLKTKMVMAVATTTVGAAIMAAGSFALFTSNVTNEGNTFTAGTVIVTDQTGGTLSSQEINAGNLAPGDGKTLTMTVKNEGTLDEWVKIDQDETNASKDGGLFEGATPMTLTLDSSVVKLAPGDETTFNVDYSLPLGADDSYQGADGSFNVKVDAVQARNNTNADGTGPNAWE